MHDRARPEAEQEALPVRLSGGRNNRVTHAGEDGDGHAADTPRGAGDEYLAAAGSDAVAFQPVERHGGGEAGRAVDHRLAQGQAGGKRDDPSGGHADVLAVSAWACWRRDRSL